MYYMATDSKNCTARCSCTKIKENLADESSSEHQQERGTKARGTRRREETESEITRIRERGTYYLRPKM
jgi:hypothetical protein